jgi:hypothetical protein
MQCRTMADYKALSLNMMHDSLEITNRIYVHMRNKDVSDRIHAFTAQVNLDPSTDLMAFLESLSIDDQRKALIFLAKILAK